MMEELGEKLAGILNDPESMARVRKMAENLLNENSEKDKPQAAQALMSGMPDANELKKIMELMAKFKNTQNDPRAALLTALKPHLSEPRKEKVDTAIKILRLIELIPYIKESNLF